MPFVLLVATAAAARDSLLQTLPGEYKKAPWRPFSNDDSKAAALLAYSKEATVTRGEGGRPAVVKVLAKTVLPVRALLDTFLAEVSLSRK